MATRLFSGGQLGQPGSFPEAGHIVVAGTAGVAITRAGADIGHAGMRGRTGLTAPGGRHAPLAGQVGALGNLG